MRPPTVLLDLDGTLVDSAAGITEHLSLAMSSVGARRHLPDELPTFIGPPFEDFMPGLGLDPDQVIAATVEYRRTYDPVAAVLSRPYPGVATRSRTNWSTQVLLPSPTPPRSWATCCWRSPPSTGPRARPAR